ncbi:MAG: MAPEG family protein, partial [Pseudomonadota bacterium]
MRVVNALFEHLPQLSEYSAAFLVLALVTLMTLAQSFLTAPLAFANEEQTPGMPLQFGHERLSFRAIRTYQNSVENLPPFFAAVLLAVIAGASATLVNIAAAIFLMARLAF